MNAIHEHIAKATDSAAFLASDLLVLHTQACNPGRPEGMSLGDKALAALVQGLLRQAREIETVLRNLA